MMDESVMNTLRTRAIANDGRECDEHPKKMTVARAVNPRMDVPSEVRIILIQHSTLEISPLITIITADWLQLGPVTRNRLTRSWSVCCSCELLVMCVVLKIE